jgi:hypothetical protein
VQAAPVPVDQAPSRGGDQLAERRDAILSQTSFEVRASDRHTGYLIVRKDRTED